MNHAKPAARPVTRRTLLRWGAAAAGAVLTGGCDSAFQVTIPDVRLKARPGSPTVAPTLGQTPLGLATGRDGLLFVPRSYTPDRAWPLLIALHGAGGTASNWASYPARAEQHGFVFLAPDSRGGTWDLSGSAGSYAFDPPFIDRALTHTFERCRIDPTKIAFAGFSDGASYALSLGVSNGDLFTRLIAFSPGFLSAGGPGVGKPPVYVSHGTSDSVLPVTSSRDVIVPSLRGIGYQVTYHEFAGGHEVPSAISTEAIEWLLGAA